MAPTSIPCQLEFVCPDRVGCRLQWCCHALCPRILSMLWRFLFNQEKGNYFYLLVHLFSSQSFTMMTDRLYSTCVSYWCQPNGVMADILRHFLDQLLPESSCSIQDQVSDQSVRYLNIFQPKAKWTQHQYLPPG